jgi:hypothetical protein
MIRIALADENLTYCHGLKTLLEQVDDFRVIILPPDTLRREILDFISMNILLVDEELYLSCREKTAQRQPFPGSVKTVILTMDRTVPEVMYHGEEVIHKGSGKREFEQCIRRLAETDI